MPIEGGLLRRCSAALAAGLVLLGSASVAQEAPVQGADFAGQAASADARYVADWAVDTHDHGKRPFAVVDKKAARIFVFDEHGRLRGTTAVLLGLMPGDTGTPGLNKSDLSRLPVRERTTPAGRFASEPGRNLKGEDIVWIDYDAALAIHRLRPSPASERRAERLASPTIDDNRISLGCVVVPVAFYENVVRPVLGRSPGVVYVLPETRSAREVFGAL